MQHPTPEEIVAYVEAKAPQNPYIQSCDFCRSEVAAIADQSIALFGRDYFINAIEGMRRGEHPRSYRPHSADLIQGY